jgi:dihydropteroate synthase
MGVVNLTPDSFSDGGKYEGVDEALAHAERMVADGADVIDIGGESTRPGAWDVDEQEEISRIRPLFQVLGKRATIPLSIDTRKSSVARVALDLGASLVNDVSALQDDPEMVRLVKRTGAGVILMHRKGPSATMQNYPVYGNVVGEVAGFLADRLAFACQESVDREQIMIDPGIGFGKTRQDNLKLLANLHPLLTLGVPVLIGASRKTFLGELTGKGILDREMGHAAIVATAVWQGAHMVRVHDVKAMKDVVTVTQALRNSIEK